MSPSLATRVLAVLLLATLALPAAAGDFTSTHRRQLKSAQVKLGLAARHLRGDDTAAAQAAVAEAEAIVETIRSESGYDADHAVFSSYNRLLAARQADLDVSSDEPAATAAEAGGISFSDDVAPVLMDNCVRCHGAGRQSAGLRLDSFAAITGQARGGPLVTPGSPERSLLVARIVTDDVLRRMPKNGAALSDETAQTLARWIADGAKFDGADETATLGSADAAKPRELPEGVTIPKPTGSETVSFTKDIAPFFVEMCVNCHTGPAARSDFSLASFHDMMSGGASGTVVIPGDRENSRLFRLTGGLELPRMPDTNQRLTRKNYEDLKTWFDEGCVFDGDDPKQTLVSIVKAASDEKAAMAAAEAGIDPVAERLRQRFAKAMPSLEVTIATSGGIYLGGDADDLDSLAAAADQTLSDLAPLSAIDFADAGGLGVMTASNSYMFREIARDLTGAAPPSGQLFFAVADGAGDARTVTAVALLDRTPKADELDNAARIKAAVAAAVAVSHGDVPQWAATGLGYATAVTSARSPVGRALAADGAAAVAKADPVLRDGSYTSRTLPAASYLIISGLLESGGRDRFRQLLEAIGGGQSADDAIESVYGTSAWQMGENLKKRL